MKAKRLKMLVQKRMDSKTPGSVDYMNRHVESLIEVIAHMLEEKEEKEEEEKSMKELIAARELKKV